MDKSLKTIIFDVEHGFCGYLQCPNGYSLMFDCGAKLDFSPAKYLKSYASYYFPTKRNGRDLTKLVVSHPHGDHVEDVENLMKELPPSMLRRQELKKYAEIDIKQRIREQDDNNLKTYRQKLDEKYTFDVINYPNWGVKITYFSLIPNDARSIAKDRVLNNTSIIMLVEFGGRKIIFTGDMETEGWDLLIKKNQNDFIEKVKGTTVFIAPHHGHKSGFSENLFKIMGRPFINIISKESEAKDANEVDSRYSKEDYSAGIKFDDGMLRRSLTTRKDGSIFMEVDSKGYLSVQPGTLPPNLKNER